jgi:hypothetical protein
MKKSLQSQYLDQLDDAQRAEDKKNEPANSAVQASPVL